MSVEDAIAAARAGRVVLLVDAETTADEVVRAAGDGAVAVRADELVLGASAVEPGAALVVIDGAAAVAGLELDLWCGPWTLARLVRERRPGGVVLIDRHGHPEIQAILGRHLELEHFGDDPAGERPGPDGSVSTDEVAAAVERARQEPLAATPPAQAALLFDLALTGYLDEVWRVPFLIHVADQSRFKPPHVDDDEQIRNFHQAYDRFVTSLGMLDSARCQLHGRQPRDLRELAAGVGLPVHELVWIFRRLDHRRVVVSKPVEDGLGERPNLEIVVGERRDLDPQETADAVASLRALRAQLAVPSPAAEPSEAQSGAPSAGDALFSSLRDAPSLVDSPPEPPPPAPPPAPAPARPARRAPPIEELPSHLPGLTELARGDLREARALLLEVDGELRPEALLLAAFRYEILDEAAVADRRFQIPEPVRDIALRALKLERVPAARFREVMDGEFPDTFVETPQPGEIEVFYDDGPLAGTHRLRELPGRARFEAPLLDGLRAVHESLMAGDMVEDAELGDPGWDALAAALRLRDGDQGEEALAALDEVDLDVDLASIRTSIVRVLPEEHPERVALEQREAEEQERQALGAVLDGIERALREGRAGEHEGFQSLEQAAQSGVLDRLADLLRRRSDDDPQDLGPALWLGRVQARGGEFTRSQEAYRRAAQMLPGNPRTIQWRFELVESALRGGGDEVAWDTLMEIIADGATPRDVDQHLERLFRAGVLSVQHHEAIRQLFDARKLRKLPRTSQRLQRQDALDPWKKALQGLAVDD